MKLRSMVAYTGLVMVFAASATAAVSPPSRPGAYASYYGNYAIAPGHVIGIDQFIDPAGKHVMLFSDYRSGIVRRLFPDSGSEFVVGPGFNVASPVELRVRFVRDAAGSVSGISLQSAQGTVSFAGRKPLKSEEVSFVDGKVRLAGTLMQPETPGPHPAIILLHGSGSLTRYSFGPYPHFFTSLGFAVLIYDKRGTGASTGESLDLGASDLWDGVSRGQPAALARLAHYPQSLEDDALAAFRYLHGRNDINPKEIGFWGSSEGGMLATQLPARNPDIAFAINSSGFEGPLWETIIYQNGAILRELGVAPAKLQKVLTYLKLWMKVARTGEDYPLLLKQREEVRKLGRLAREVPPLGKGVPTLKEMRWDWNHVLSFNSLPALRKISCPLLGLWGARDPETDAREAETSARAVLSGSGNRDFALKIFPDANHALQEMPSRARMAPGVFATLRSWFRAHAGNHKNQD